MDVVRQLDEHLWREFVDNHPQGNVFHTPEMFQVFAAARGFQPTLWAAVNRGKRSPEFCLGLQHVHRGQLTVNWADTEGR